MEKKRGRRESSRDKKISVLRGITRVRREREGGEGKWERKRGREEDFFSQFPLDRNNFCRKETRGGRERGVHGREREREKEREREREGEEGRERGRKSERERWRRNLPPTSHARERRRSGFSLSRKREESAGERERER